MDFKPYPLAHILAQLRLHLAQADALLPLAVLGVVCGLLTSGTILLFRMAIEGPLDFLLPGNHHENFEELDAFVRLILPITGAVILAFIFRAMKPKMRMVGISHVLERLEKHQGHMPLGNFFAQFIGGVICALSGQSTGREGPAVHLGAASGSLLGHKLRLPTHHTHILLAAGVAAAISASFNTPMAGVIFAMEVIIVGYSLQSFIPVILASVVGAMLTRAVYGSEPAFIVPPLEMRSLLEFPFLVAEGLMLGALAAAFIWVCTQTAKIAPKSLWTRFGLIGLLNGLLALSIPQIMGIGYDTVNQALFGQLAVIVLLILAIAKLLITSVNLGLGQPGGAIGPMLFIGACAGGVIGEVGNFFAPDQASSSGYYAMLGMAAMMSACLQAPLTGLITLFELTGNPNIILPAMLVVVIANLTTTEVFKQKALFPRLLQLRGLTLDSSPVEKMLRQGNVTSVIERNVIPLPKFACISLIEDTLEQQPQWIAIRNEQSIVSAVFPAADLVNLMLDKNALKQWQEDHDDNQAINLMAIPAERKRSLPISLQANLQQALDKMAQHNVEILTVHLNEDESGESLIGFVDQDNIHSYYRYIS